MKSIIQKLVLLLSILLPLGNAFAQNITGTWVTLRNEEYMQFNIEQRGNELCGFTYDYELNNKSSYCIAQFIGKSDAKNSIWYISGTGFIENSGSHVLMRIIIWRNSSDPLHILRGKVFLQSEPNNLFGMGGDDIIIRKTSSVPKKLSKMAPCFPKKVQPKKEIPENRPPSNVNPPVTLIPKQKIPIQKQKAPEQSLTVDSKQKQPKEKIEVVPTKRSVELRGIEKSMLLRKQVEQGRIVVTVPKLKISIYDNGTIDGDTVSVFYNGKLLIGQQRLTDKAIEIQVDLDRSVEKHEITLFAENLGDISPNTALVIITAGTARYELRSKANLEENALLVFEYKPNAASNLNK